MFTHLETQLQGRYDLLLSGRYLDLARTYILPLVVYCDDQLLHLADTDAVACFLRRLHSILIARGIKTRRVRVIAVGLPIRKRFKVWASLTQDGGGVGATRAVFYMVETPQGLQSEMVEFLGGEYPETIGIRRANVAQA